MVYSIGWYHHSKGYHIFVAETEHELCTGSFLWKALKKWKQLAEDQPILLDEHGHEIKKTLYIYAHNGAKFDVIPIIRAILTATGKPVGGMLCSNGNLSHSLGRTSFPATACS